MRLRRIEIRDFRKIGHLVIDGLGDGLNVLVGDNEAGKSTILAALRAVLFERHRVGGSTVKAMLPHAAEVRPEITIDFEVAGGTYRLRKAFNQRPEAELVGPGGTRIAGDAVEERLAALLGFQAPGARGSKPDEHQGVYGLLWVDQGLAHTPLNSGGGQASLANALESEVGQVLGGERGRHLLAAAEQRREAFWDKRETPKPKGDFKAAQETIETMSAERDALESRLRSYDEKVSTLAGKAEILQRHAREDRLAQAARAADTAREAVGKAGALRATLDEIGRTHQRAVLDRETAAARVVARRQLVAQAETARGKASLSQTEAEAARTALAMARRAAGTAAGDLAAARRDRDRAAETLADLEHTLLRTKARLDFARVAGQLKDAEAVDGRQRDALAAAQAIRVGKKDLAEIDKLCAERDQARTRRDAASVEIAFHPLPGAGGVTIDGMPNAADTPILIARDATIDIEGFGRLSVRPGGGVVELARTVEAAERRLDDRLRGLGQTTRHDLANVLARKAEAEAEAAAQARVFAVLAPQGLDVLRAALRDLEAATEPGFSAPGTTPTEADRTALRRDHAQSQATEKTTAAAALAAEAAREQADRQAAILTERAEGAASAEAGALSALQAARLAVTDERLDSELATLDRGLALSSEAATAARTALDAADPETAALILKRAEAAERAIREDVETLNRDKLVLETELRTLGQEGLGEALEEIQGQLELRRRQLADTSLEAQASLLLHRTLASAQRASKDRWLGPVRERVRPYLRLIQPDSEITLNEKTFSIEHLVRGGVSEPFETLSVGAREQVAVITRLALADILRASGQATAIILDDALVNTDEARLERMHLVLHKAAESLQVIVLTCRERDFIALGAPIRRL